MECANCKKLFIPRNPTYKNCSIDCSKEWNRTKARIWYEMHRVDTTRQCKICQIEFKATGTQICCSIECQIVNRREIGRRYLAVRRKPLVPKECCVCGILFQPPPRKAKSKTCSSTCLREYKNTSHREYVKKTAWKPDHLKYRAASERRYMRIKIRLEEDPEFKREFLNKRLNSVRKANAKRAAIIAAVKELNLINHGE